MKALYIEWQDSSSTHANQVWKQRDDVIGQSLVCCKTIGFVIEEDKYSVLLAGSVTNGDQLAGDLRIPVSAIRKRRVVTWRK